MNHRTSLSPQRKGTKTTRTTFSKLQSYSSWILPFETELKPDTRPNSFSSKDSLNKKLGTLFYRSLFPQAIYIPPRRLVSSRGHRFARHRRTTEGEVARFRRIHPYRFHHVSPGHATLSAPFTDHHDAIFPPNPPPTCTRIYRANRKHPTWIHWFDSYPLSSA